MQPAEQQQEEQEGAQPLRFDSLSPKEFIALADMYIGGLWTRIERGLREAEGEASGAAGRARRDCLLLPVPAVGTDFVQTTCSWASPWLYC
jgi:hypothetical protein